MLLSPSRRLVALLVALLLSSGAWAIRAPERRIAPDFDVRLPAEPEQRPAFTLRTPTPLQRAAAAGWLAERAGTTLRWDGMSGSAKWVAAAPGDALSNPRTGDPREIALDFLRERAALLGVRRGVVDHLEVTSTTPAPGGGAHVYLTQRNGGVEVFGGRGLVHVRGDGAVIAASSTLFAGMQVAAESAAPSLSAADAVRAALRDVYPQLLFNDRVVLEERGAERRVRFDGTGFGREPEARLMLFPEARGARLAWRVRVAEPTLFTDFELLLDAADGALLSRRNLTLYAEASFVDGQAPEPQGREYRPDNLATQAIPAATAESPSGWIDAPGTALSGNNAVGHALYYTAAPLQDAAGSFVFPFNTVAGATVNAWWWSNDAHDRFYRAGFDEAAGNYQASNFGLGGVEGDPLDVTAMANGGRNNAYYTRSADGGRSTTNYFWVTCSGCGEHDGFPENGGERSAAYMRDVVYHEYGHGVSIRLAGGPGDDSCLGGMQSAAMGEGWSDLFSAAFTNDPQIGDHFFDGSGWMRDLRNDNTYDELCAVGDFGCAVHSNGTIWSGTLWKIRQSMIALGGASAAEDFISLVIEGLANTPCAPTMLDARDGILTADAALFASAHHDLIWHAFASRGMGELASSTDESDSSPVTDYTVPAANLCTPPAAASGLTATAGTNEITLAYTASGASAVQIWRRETGQPDAAFRWVASTTDSGGYVDGGLTGGRGYEYYVVPLGAGGVDCAGGPSGVDGAIAGGACTAGGFDFEPGLAVTDGAGCGVTLSWSAAVPHCAGDPVSYNVYRSAIPGFEPSDRTLIARTASTSIALESPQSAAGPFYLVTAQIGDTASTPDHGRAEFSQILQWEGHVASGSRSLFQSWDFESGPQGWTVDNADDPNGGWLVASPTGTRYGDTWLSPDGCAGGSQCFVTGDGPASPATANDSDGQNELISPTWDGTNDATLLAFDYWHHSRGGFFGGLQLTIDNGSQSVTLLDIGLMTAQRFDTDASHGWQHFEIDLAQHVTPSSTMNVVFRGLNGDPLSEFGIDNVEVYTIGSCGSRADLAIASLTADDTIAGGGNGNGLLEPGETVQLALTLRNDGSAPATTPSGRLSLAPAGMLVHEAQDSFPTLAAGGGTGASAGNGFNVTLPAAYDCGEALTLQFEFETAEGELFTLPWTLELGSVVTDTLLSDDFETDQGWQAEGDPGLGVWQLGDPVGTLNGSDEANPEDCAGGTGCYVTENGAPGGDPNLTDVDEFGPFLYSPHVDLTGYKRSRMSFDLWFYDDSTSGDFWQDYCRYGAFIDDPIIQNATQQYRGDVSSWQSLQLDTTSSLPNVADVRLFFQAADRNENQSGSYTDHVVEMGIDNVTFEADRFTCAASGVGFPPNVVGATLFVDRTPAGAGLSWTAPPTDATHDAAAYFEVYVSAAPDAGFSVAQTSTLTSDDVDSGEATEYYTIVAVNAAGSSGDEPAP